MYIRIRPITLEDYARILPLQLESVKLHSLGRPDLFKQNCNCFTKEDLRNKLEKPKHTALLAENELGEVVGYVFAWVVSNRDHPTFRDYDLFYIDDICVLKKFQRNGVGKALFAACKERAKELCCSSIDLLVWSFNQDAIAFYERCGMHERTCRMEYRLD